MDKAIQFLRSKRAEHLEWARELCRIPSISTKPENAGDVRKAVEWTRDVCQQAGLKAEIHETKRHPLVYAEHCQAPGAPTLLVYGHVDVQPTGDLKLWDADPFEPVVKNDWLICRGSADDKGQVLLHIRAAQAWLQAEGKLPVNLKFLIEGEEEIGSPNLPTFVQGHKDKLACDAVIISDTGMHADGYPTITCGTRGMVYKEVHLFGPSHDLHSGSFGGSVANPANVLAGIIASLHDADRRVTIPGFYDDVVNLSDAERKELGKLPFDQAQYMKDLGVPGLMGEKGYTPNEQRTIRPTLDVNGIFGGFQGEGSNTIIPAWAGAKMSMRLVPNMSGPKVSKLFDEAITARCPDSVRLKIINHEPACDAYMSPMDSKEMAAAKQALHEAFDHDVALIREGGSLPILPMFKQALGAECLLLGFASPNCNAHGPNEKARIPDLDRGAEAIARFFAYVAK